MAPLKNSRRRDERFELRMSSEEKHLLSEKAAAMGMSPSAYLRALVASTEGGLSVIDVKPIEASLSETHRQGVNLNMLVRHLNTYGADALYPSLAEQAESTLKAERKAFERLSDALGELRKKTERSRVHIAEMPETEKEAHR